MTGASRSPTPAALRAAGALADIPVLPERSARVSLLEPRTAVRGGGDDGDDDDSSYYIIIYIYYNTCHTCTRPDRKKGRKRVIMRERVIVREREREREREYDKERERERIEERERESVCVCVCV
jgi:hypothetical protein